jgi:hypothetical protein
MRIDWGDVYGGLVVAAIAIWATIIIFGVLGHP